jgi:hypothetical protein
LPSFWAHRICADITLERLEGSAAASLIKKDIASYRLGSQGADLMYFRPTQFIRGRSGVVYHAKMLHGQSVEKLATMSGKYLAGATGTRQFDSIFAYACGFLSHHAVDQKVHPFIETMAVSALRHRRIELDLDAHMSRELDIKPFSNPRWSGAGDFIGFADLAQWYNFMFHGLFNIRFSMRSYMKDYNAMRRVSVFMDRPGKLEKLQYADRPVLPERELNSMLRAAMLGANQAAEMIEKLYEKLELDNWYIIETEKKAVGYIL